MKIKEFLNKSGILRAGTTATTYKSSKDRPTEFLMDGVFNAKKDIITKKNLKKAKAKTANAFNAKTKPTKGRKIFFWITTVLALLLLLSYIGSGSIWVMIFGTLLIGAFIFFLYKFAFVGQFVWWFAIIVFFIFILIGLILVPSSDESGSADKIPAASYDELLRYDKKVINITSTDGKLVGTAGFSLKKDSKNKPYLDTYYNLIINDALPKNGNLANNGIQLGYGYDYVNNLVDPSLDSGEGDLSSIFCNKDLVISNPYVSASPQYSCNGINTANMTTEKFIASFSRWYRSYEEFSIRNAFELYDSSAYWVEEKGSDNTSSWSVDDDKAVGEGQKIRSYTLQFK